MLNHVLVYGLCSLREYESLCSGASSVDCCASKHHHKRTNVSCVTKKFEWIFSCCWTVEKHKPELNVARIFGYAHFSRQQAAQSEIKIMQHVPLFALSLFWRCCLTLWSYVLWLFHTLSARRKLNKSWSLAKCPQGFIIRLRCSCLNVTNLRTDAWRRGERTSQPRKTIVWSPPFKVFLLHNLSSP